MGGARASPNAFSSIRKRLKLVDAFSKFVHAQFPEHFMPDVIGVVLHHGNDPAHFRENSRFFLVVHIALKQFQDIQAVFRIVDKGGKQNIQAIIHANKFIPNPHATAQGGLIIAETGLGEIIRFNRLENIFVARREQLNAMLTPVERSGPRTVPRPRS